MNIRIHDKKNNALAYFGLGYSSGKLFSTPSVLECVQFEVYQKDAAFSFDEPRDNYDVVII